MKTSEGRTVATAGGINRFIEPGMSVRVNVPDLPGWYRVKAMNRASVRLVTSEPRWNADGSLRVPGSTSPIAFAKITHTWSRS